MSSARQRPLRVSVDGTTTSTQSSYNGAVQLLSDRYRIVEPLGTGGIAEVYLAHDDVLERDVASKVLNRPHAADPLLVERFKR
jgi:serine/threonine protein kinase